MRKRTLKQKCLAWLLSLAVALTFIPLTAGFAFADNVQGAGADFTINLAKANGGDVGETEVKVSTNFEEPWQVDKNLVKAVVYTGEKQEPVLSNVSCKMGVGTFTLEDKDAAGNSYFSVDPGKGNWTDEGTYSFSVVANEDAAPVEFNFNGEDHTAKFTGKFTMDCKIVKDLSDLAAGEAIFDEGSINKKGEIEVAYDGKLHKLVPAAVIDALGNIVDPSCYEVTYPNETTNAYRKVGQFEIVISAVKGNAGGYTGSITKVVSITDVVTDITVYAQKGLSGERAQAKVFKYAKWGNYSLDTPLDWGYNGNVLGTSTSYIPVETLLAEAGLGEVGKFNAKDQIDLWTNTDAEHYFNAPQSIGDLQKFKYVVGSNDEVLKVFGGEFSIPAFLVLDCDVASFNPRGAVGSEVAGDFPRGNMSPSAVSEISLVSMDLAGVEVKAENATYTGKAVVPVVTVDGGAVEDPLVTVEATAKKVGPASAKVTANEDSIYYGTTTVKYNVVPKGTTIKSLKKGKKKFTVKWKKQKTQTSGYQVRYSTKSDFSGAKIKTVKKSKKVKATVKKLKKKTTYYVQVRTYKTVKGKKYCSEWSDVKTVKTK